MESRREGEGRERVLVHPVSERARHAPGPGSCCERVPGMLGEECVECSMTYDDVQCIQGWGFGGIKSVWVIMCLAWA